MKPMIPEGSIDCMRCGMMLHADLARWHKCKGSDKNVRPANISAEDWSMGVRDSSEEILEAMHGSAAKRHHPVPDEVEPRDLYTVPAVGPWDDPMFLTGVAIGAVVLILVGLTLGMLL